MTLQIGNHATKNIARNFEAFNPYARAAVETEDAGNDGTVFAIVAIAFEVSQLRYQLTKPNGQKG